MTITDTPQKAKLYALFDDAPVVFACRINQSFTTHDKVTEFKYDGITLGAYTDVKAGMTVLFGSTPGAHDKGISYARKTPTTNKLYCGETSEVDFANNLYVTVLEDFGIWADYPLVLADSKCLMKHDVAYSDQHTKMKPVPILGPDRVEIVDGFWTKDESGKLWTVGGDAQQDTAVKIVDAASVLLDGAGDYLSTPHHADWDFGPSDLTIEGWIKSTQTTNGVILEKRPGAAFGAGCFVLYLGAVTPGALSFYSGDYSISVAVVETAGGIFNTGAWVHFALVKSGSAWKIYADGLEVASATHTITASALAQGVTIGYSSYYGLYLAANLDEMRVSNVARYTESFTPQSLPFGLDAHTISLLHFEGLTSTSVSFDGSDSYAPGSTISGHSFNCSGATVTGGSTATPTVTLTALGRYLLRYTVTSALGASSTTYRTIHIVQRDALNEVTAGSINGSFGSGFSFALTTLNTTITARQRSKVILIADEWYADTKESFGPCVGAEQIVAIGWIENETVSVDEEHGAVSFSARGADYWLGETSNFKPLGFRSVTGAPTTWLEIKDMTVDRVLWHLFVWRSTVCNCIDVVLTGDTRNASELTAPEGTLSEQIKTFAHKVLATANSDRYSRLFIEIEAVYLPTAERGDIPVTATLTHDDWESIEIEYNTVAKTSQVILSGVAIKNNLGLARVSLAPGHIPQHYGAELSLEALVLSTQGAANVLAGNVLSKENAPYKFSIKNLTHNNRLIGIAPRQFVALEVLAEDNLRGIAYSGHALVKSIEYILQDGAWEINLVAEMETFPGLNTTGDIIKPPASEDDSNIEPQPIIPISPVPPVPFPIPPDPPPPVPIPPDPTSCTDDSPATGPYAATWDRFLIDGGADVSTRITRLWLPCAIRSSTATNQSYLSFEINNLGAAYAHLHCYGIDSAGNRLVTGAITATEYDIRVDFAPVAALTVAGFELECDEGMDWEGAALALEECTFFQNSTYGVTHEISQDLVMDDPDHGALGWFLQLHASTQWPGTSWRHWARLVPQMGSSGTLYAYVSYLINSSDQSRLPLRHFSEPIIEIGGGYSSFAQLVKIAEIENASTEIWVYFDIGTPTFFFPDIEFWVTMHIDYYYSATIPARSLGLGAVGVYNVCPAVPA
jgi:hypothetical protein